MYIRKIPVRRPMIWFASMFAVGCGMVLWKEYSLSVWITAIAVLSAVLLGYRFPKTFPFCLMAAGLVCGISYTNLYHGYFIQPLEKLDNRTRQAVVTITDFPTEYEKNYRAEVRIQLKEEKLDAFHSLVYFPKTVGKLMPGDRITGKVSFTVPKERNGFDRKSYYRSNGYVVLGTMQSVKEVIRPETGQRPLTFFPKLLAKRLQEVYSAHGTERQAAFWRALSVGDRSKLTTTDTDHLRKAGLSHVIALSGMHIGFLVAILMKIFGKKLGTALGIPILCAFVVMVGWSPSVLRACIMYSIVMLGFWLKRQADSINSLFAALLFILLYLPDTLGSVSLQLSFASTFGILWLMPRMTAAWKLPKKTPRLCKRLWGVITGTIQCTIGSTLLTAPILLYHFGYLSAFSVLANVLVLWAVAMVYPFIMLAGLLGLCFPSIAEILFYPIGWLTDYIWYMTDWCAGLSYGILYYEDTIDFIAAIVLCITAAILIWKGNRIWVSVTIPAVLLILVGISIWRGDAMRNDLRVSILSEGRGQAILVTCGDQTALIDCSGSGYHDVVADIRDYMDWWSIDDIDLVILTSVDQTHARNICSLLAAVPVKQVVFPEENREDRAPFPQLMIALKNRGIRYRQIAPETEFSIGHDSLGLSVLGLVERKLVVRISSEDQDILTVHALTQKMLLELLEQTPLTCDTLIVSGGFFEEWSVAKQLLSQFSPNEIVLENGFESGKSIEQIPILNPYYIGQIDRKTIRLEKGR